MGEVKKILDELYTDQNSEGARVVSIAELSNEANELLNKSVPTKKPCHNYPSSLQIKAVKLEGNEFVTDSENHSLLEELEPLRMTSEKPVPELKPIVSLGKSTVCTSGNVTAISGEGKSGKSAFVGVVMAGAIADGEYDGFEDLTIIPNVHKLALIHAETENSEPRHKVNHITILERCEIKKTPDNFISLNLRSKSTEEYKGIIENACAGAMEKFKGIFLIVIDGGADFISDVNEAAEANAIVKWFEQLAIKYNCPVIVIVHVNPGSEKERGHLGSQLQRKAESLLFIKRNEDVSTIEPKLLRNAGIGDTPMIQFTYDKTKGYHVSCGMKSKLTEVTKDFARVENIKKIAGMVFAEQKSFGYNEAQEVIMKISKKGVTGAKNIFTEMKAHELIVQGKDKKWSLNITAV